MDQQQVLKLLLLISTCALIHGRPLNFDTAGTSVATVYVELVAGKEVYSIVKGKLDPAGVAQVEYSDAAVHESFFGELRVSTTATFSDTTQMFAAGYAEASMTVDRTFDHYTNILPWIRSQVHNDTQPIIEFLTKQDIWIQDQLKSENLSDFWYNIGVIHAQLQGFAKGYNDAAPAEKQLPYHAFLILNGVGDLLDVIQALKPDVRPDWENMDPDQIKSKIAMTGMCSGLVKVTGDLSDLLFSHSSWFIYNAMTRIYKHYNFNLNHSSVAAKKVSFSSYPGFLESLDDFYIMDSGLAMIQTTNNIYNTTLYDSVTPFSVLAWQRVRAANQMATTGEEWKTVIATENSGTYNNQYMVINLNLFTPGKPLPANLLWVVEQIPGLVVGADKTETLERGYWPSYNVPYFPEVYSKSGYPALQAALSSKGSQYIDATLGLDYQLAPRAEIFRRDASSVVDIPSLKHLMRYNGYPSDPYDGGSPMGAICSRGDLQKKDPAPEGCYDTKVSSYTLALNLQSQAINGPTAQNQPPFQWTGAFSNSSHVGMPETFNFKFEAQDPKWDAWERRLHGDDATIAIQ